MRLLLVDENSEFSLTDDLVSNIPPYAILSHTWAEDDEEVNFRDLTIGPRRTKSGYKKLRFCAERASRDGLQHFWVDTCCIDKANNTELSEAINSMFRWYQKADKCYVYLSDISTGDHSQANTSWEEAFRQSRWFRRGWTLQELIAPASVEFFCSNGNRLGDKISLERQLHEITGIAVLALQGIRLSTFSINERMIWAENRETKREEDKAYSLLGIFDIHMPLIYGEGKENALARLHEEIHRRRNQHRPDEILRTLQPQRGQSSTVSSPRNTRPLNSRPPIQLEFFSHSSKYKTLIIDNNGILTGGR